MTAIVADVDPADPRIRFGLYLRPSPRMAQAVAAMHEVMRRQFGQTRAGMYMPHATIGFFRSAVPWEEIAAAVTPILNGRSAFMVQNHGPMHHGNSVVLDIHHGDDGAPNADLVALHDDAYAALSPLLSNDPGDSHRWAAQFHAHITLAQAVRPDWLLDEVLAFVRDAEPIGTRRFLAEYVHLYVVRSEDWDSTDWSDSLTWDLLTSWRLKSGR
jgi:hypothetical protein